MIVWIDGTYGVGKTSIAYKVENVFSGAEVLESDVYWTEIFKKIIDETPKGCIPNFGGCLPQNNLRFIEEFKAIIEQKEKTERKIVVIDMTLATNCCRDRLISYFRDKNINMLHFIIEADENEIRERINNDDKRSDKTLALGELKQNLLFYGNNYIDAIRINTIDKTINDAVDEIVQIISRYKENM